LLLVVVLLLAVVVVVGLDSRNRACFIFIFPTMQSEQFVWERDPRPHFGNPFVRTLQLEAADSALLESRVELLHRAIRARILASLGQPRPNFGLSFWQRHT
jgi:hypothetical protein